MKDTHHQRIEEVKRIQAERDSLDKLPEELHLALAQANSLSCHRVSHVLDRVKQKATVEEIVAEEKAHFDNLGARYNFDYNSIRWIQLSPFFAEFSRWIRKRVSDKGPGGTPNPTAMAVYNPKTEEYEIVYNPRFLASLAGASKSTDGVEPHGCAINEHEHLHLILSHCTARRREPAALDNIAKDLAINSLIARNDTSSRLPSMCLLPATRSSGPIGKEVPPEVKEAHEKFNEIISKLPQEQASEWYFNKLTQESEKNGYQWGKTGLKVPGKPNPDGGEDGEWELFGSGGSHTGWDDIPEEIRDIVEGKLKHALRKSCEAADNNSNGWGNIPSELREEIRAMAYGRLDWRAILKNWTGMRQAGGRSRSIKRIDRKYPMIHPGLKRKRSPSILVAVDQSGSVDDEQLARIFGALDGCAKQITFDVLPFDYGVAENELFTWKRGTKPNIKRVRSGGTSFDAVVEWLNDPKNRGRYDGAIIATDGEAPKPRDSRVKLAWMITPGHKLMFAPENSELVIEMSDSDDVKPGRW